MKKRAIILISVILVTYIMLKFLEKDSSSQKGSIKTPASQELNNSPTNK